MEPRRYQFSNSTLSIIVGDITTSKAEVIASLDDADISMSNGVSAGILNAGGESIRNDAHKKLPAQLGDVIVSSAGEMAQKYIFHCLTIDRESTVDDGEIFYDDTISILEKSITSCFRLVDALNLRSIAFPCLGIETPHCSVKDVVEMMVDEMLFYVFERMIRCDIEIYICDSNVIDESFYQEIVSVLDSYYTRKQYRCYRQNLFPCVSEQEEQKNTPNTRKDEFDDDEFVVNLTIDGTEYEEVEVKVTDPLDTIRDQIKNIVQVFDLPKVDNGGNPLYYLLCKMIDGEPVILEFEDEDGREQCLLDYNVQTGDDLQMISIPIAGGSGSINDTKLEAFHMPKKKHFLNRLFERKASTAFSSLFAPHEISKGEGMMIQVYIYRDVERDDVCNDAVKCDKYAKEKAYTPLNFKLSKGDVVDVNIRIRGIDIERPHKSLVWQGHYTKVSFYAIIPNDYNESNIWGEVFLSVNNALLGELDFMTNVIPGFSEKQETAPVYSRQYKKIFISYAHQDEMKVKYIAQAYQAQGVDYFFDRHYLKAGDIFPQVIQNYIETADLFILCWSENAAKSEYVEKEREQALSLAYPKVKPLEKAKLSIYPMSIEPRAELPSDMKDNYHFGEM